ncbi:MAG TPA: hypothetical protein VJY39_16060 [Acidisphaera sp.]|nr:hypothetical protein [Acidisphaera sp.]
MTTIATLAARHTTQPRSRQPSEKPVMTWVIDPASGRPVMAWSLPQSAVDKLAA